MDKFTGYIEIEAGGKVRPLKFSVGCWLMLAEKTKMSSLNELFEKSSSYIHEAIYCAAIVGYRTARMPIDFTEDDVFIWVDELGLEKINEVVEVMSLSFSLDEKKEVKDAKKKTK